MRICIQDIPKNHMRIFLRTSFSSLESKLWTDARSKFLAKSFNFLSSSRSRIKSTIDQRNFSPYQVSTNLDTRFEFTIFGLKKFEFRSFGSTKYVEGFNLKPQI